MYVTVRRVVDPDRGVVEATTALGRLELVWQEAPVPAGGEHHVELDVPDVLGWGREIWPVSMGVPAPPPPKGQRIRGRLMGLDEHDVATIATADGWLLVTTSGDPPLGTTGEEVELETLRLLAFPVHY